MNATVLMLMACLAAPPDVPMVVDAKPLPELDAKFRRVDGWVGGDGAFSVATSDKRTLWLFSDTWVGTVRDGKRKNVAMVNNTIGIQDGNGADAKITFAIAKDADNKPGTLFVPPDGKGWFWIFAGYHADSKLHVFLPRLEKAAGPAAFGVWVALWTLLPIAGLFIGAMSYLDQMDVGILADPDALDDPFEMADGIACELSVLVGRAREQVASRKPTRPPRDAARGPKQAGARPRKGSVEPRPS